MNVSDQTLDPIERKAADWVMRHRQGRLSAREEAAYRHWLAADPRHTAAAERADRAWQASAALKRRAGYVRPARPSGPRAWLQSLIQAPLLTGGTLSAAAVACWMWLAPPFWVQALGSDYHTGWGETRHVTLADGSQIELGSRSILTLAYDDQTRRVRLGQGEAVFSPAPVTEQERRPFSVQTPGAALTARGTRYVVGVSDERQGWLGVLQHSVEVQLEPRGLDDMAGSAVVEQGSSLSFGPRQGLLPLDASPDELASWQEGRLVLRREPLAEAVARIGRYRPGLVLIRGYALRKVRVSAVVRLDNLDAAVTLLAAQARARSVELPGLTLIY